MAARDGYLTNGGAFAAEQAPEGPPVYAEARASYNPAPCGDVAQLGERRVRNAEVVSSILIVSTIISRPTAFPVGLVVCESRLPPGIGAMSTEMAWGLPRLEAVPTSLRLADGRRAADGGRRALDRAWTAARSLGQGQYRATILVTAIKVPILRTTVYDEALARSVCPFAEIVLDRRDPDPRQSP